MSKRVFYAGQMVGLAKDGTTTFIEAHGVQSVGITTNFNLEQVFELGQISLYQNIEQVPDIEVTMEKVLDGYPLLYHLATNGSTSPTISGRSNAKTTVALSVFSDTQDSASGIPVAEVRMSGLAVSALTYTIPVDGNCTESVTLVGNDKVWYDDAANPGNALFTGRFNNQDQPLYSGGVMRRQHVVMSPISGGPTGVDVNGANAGWVSTWPSEIPGLNADGTNPLGPDGTYVAPIQTVTFSVDLGRQEIFELGIRSPYTRYVNFPVEVRTEIEVLATKWDSVSATNAGNNNGATNGNNTKYQTIKVRLVDGTYIQTGVKNKLTTVAYSGGDAGGGGSNVSLRYSFISYNEFVISHPQDPSGL